MVSKQNRLGQEVKNMTSHLGSSMQASRGSGWWGSGVTVRLQRTMENQRVWEYSWGSETSTQPIPSESPTGTAYFPKDISSMDIKDHKVHSAGARVLENLHFITPAFLCQPQSQQCTSQSFLTAPAVKRKVFKKNK